MDSELQEFLKTHPAASRWLNDIIAVLMRSFGRAHVKDIAHELSKCYGRDVNTTEQTVTRRLNDFCSDAADFKKDEKYDLFERIDAATYRLRGYPKRPDILELGKIEFDEIALESMWDTFEAIARRKNRTKWRSSSNKEKLTYFITWISKNENAEEYRHRQKLYEGVAEKC